MEKVPALALRVPAAGDQGRRGNPAARRRRQAGRRAPSSSIDPTAGWLRAQGARSGRRPEHPSGLLPTSPPGDELSASRSPATVAAQVLAGAADRCARDRCSAPAAVPPHGPARPGEGAAAAVRRLGRALDGERARRPGPAGAGKTYTGARLIRRCSARPRVGVTAPVHAVIGNLLDAVGRRPRPCRCRSAKADDLSAQRRRRAARRQQRAGASTRWTPATSTLVAGTAWLWARERAGRPVDVLVVDEAGQLSLANTSRSAGGGEPGAARRPAAARQPSQASTPTAPTCRRWSTCWTGTTRARRPRRLPGPTWRMRPGASPRSSPSSSYDGTARVRCRPGTAGRRRRAGARRARAAAGCRCCTRATASARPRRRGGRRGCWSSPDGRHVASTAAASSAVMRPEDVLVVAPYNAQVAEVRDALPAARAGRHGRQVPGPGGRGRRSTRWPASSAADAPRGVDFLSTCTGSTWRCPGPRRVGRRRRQPGAARRRRCRHPSSCARSTRCAGSSSWPNLRLRRHTAVCPILPLTRRW